MFDDVIGQQHITTTLKNAIRFNRVAHGYLFCGSRGVGKTSTARIFARALNCEKGPTLTPCGKCAACTEIIQGNCMDVIEIDGASNRGIDEIRELRDSVKFVPNHAKYKVYIVDEVHMLTKDAFNALLKTLEEPPAHAIFIFATTEPHEVPQTILSRCQVFEFHRVPAAQIARKLGEIAQSEGIDAEPGVLDALARAGDGSVRDSQSMFDQVISFCGTKITADQISEVLGVYERDIFFDIAGYAYSKDIAQGIKIIDSIISGGKNVNHFMDGLLTHFRYLLLVKLLEEKTDVLDCPAEFIDKYRRQSDLYTAGELEFAVELISETAIKMRYALSKQILLELLFLKLSRLKSILTVDQALNKLEELDARLRISGAKIPPEPGPRNQVSHHPKSELEYKTGLDKQPRPNAKCEFPAQNEPESAPAEPLRSQPQPANPNELDPPEGQINPVSAQTIEAQSKQKPEINLDTISRSWHSVCRSCGNQLLSHFLEDSVTLEEFADGTLYLGVGEFNFSLFRDREKEVAQVLKNFFAEPINVRFKVSGNNSAQKSGRKPESGLPESKPAQAPADKPEIGLRIEDRILKDPVIEKLIDTFDAKIITVRRKP